MGRTLKSEQRLIESISLPVSLRLPPITGVTSEAKKNFVPADVLRSLIGVPATCAGRANQSQSQCVFVGFVGGVLAIGQNRRAVSSVFVRQIDPLMRSHFNLALLCVRP